MKNKTVLLQEQLIIFSSIEEMKLDDENKTIGIVLCQEKNQSLVEYTLPEDNERIGDRD